MKLIDHEYTARATASPFWREKPTTSTTLREFAWCNLWIKDGRVVVVEWL